MILNINMNNDRENYNFISIIERCFSNNKEFDLYPVKEYKYVEMPTVNECPSMGRGGLASKNSICWNNSTLPIQISSDMFITLNYDVTFLKNIIEKSEKFGFIDATDINCFLEHYNNLKINVDKNIIK